MFDLKTPVSGRQFAKMVGRAESAVRKARDRQSIIEGFTADGKFIPEIAAREWGVEILSEFGGSVSKTPTPIKIKPSKPSKKEKPDPVTADEFINEMMHEPVAKVSQEEIDEFDEHFEIEVSEGTSKVEAERQIAIFKAKMARLAYEEKKGTMINIEKLKVIYEHGALLRSEIEGIPDRIIDEVLANAEDRKAAKRILVEEIYNTLNRCTELKISL